MKTGSKPVIVYSLGAIQVLNNSFCVEYNTDSAARQEARMASFGIFVANAGQQSCQDVWVLHHQG